MIFSDGFLDGWIITSPESLLHFRGVVFCNTYYSEGESVMAIDSKLQLAANAIQDARKRMERAKDDADDDYEIRQALKMLDEATEYIRGALSELQKVK